MGKFERKCPLLTAEARQQLNVLDAQRTRTISKELKLATKNVCELPEEYVLHSGQLQAEIADRSQLLFSRQKLIETVANEGCDGVREFANAVLKSQRRVGSDAGLLRKYTALIIRDLREWLNYSILFRDEPLGGWQNDAIAQETIRCCESIVAERWTLGDHWPYGTYEANAGAWPALIMEWEAHKDPDNVHPNRDERLSEFALRIILSSQRGIEPGDVTWEQIRNSASDFCRHYGPVLLVPNCANEPPETLAEPIADAKFWREREDEFRKHDEGENTSVAALWSSVDGKWLLLDELSEPATPQSKRIFKSLAREVYKGFTGAQNDESWIDWLNAMRRAKYGERSEFGPGVLTEKGIEMHRVAGQPLSAGGMIRFVPIPKRPNGPADEPNAPGVTGIDHIATERAWDSVVITIENVFDASAEFCLELRSVAITQDAHEAPAKGANTYAESDKSGTPAFSWEDIEIVFLSAFMIQIKINGQPQPPQNYAELGFEDRRSENPVAAWETLRKLAQQAGVYRMAADSKQWTRIEKRIQEIRKAFRRHFALSSDPIPFRRKTPRNREDFGYRTAFRIRFHTASDV